MEKPGTPQLATSSAPAKRIPNGTVLVVATLLVAIAISAFGIYKMRGRKRTSISFQNVKLLKLTTSGKVVVAAISPGGRDFAYVASEAGKETLWIKPVANAGRELEIVPASEGNYLGLSFSPDGNFIYYVRSIEGQPNTIFRIPALGGTSITLNKDVDSPVAFSPDGKFMSYLRGYPDSKETALIVAPIDGTSERKVVALKNPSGFVVTSAPAWSSDSKQIAAVGKQEESGAPYQQILIVTVADGSISLLEKAHWQQVGGLAWCSDGNSLLVTATDQHSPGSQIYQVSYPSGQTQRVTNDLADYQQVTLTRDSRQILAVQNERQANLWTRDVILLSGS
jgi:Periplasmic component of the Tol biopolymer transport system